MKISKKRLKEFRKSDIVLGLLLLVIITVLLGKIFLVKDCEKSGDCFDKMAAKCWPAKMFKINEDNMYKYTIKGRGLRSCVVEVENVQMALGTSVEMVERFEGKSMRCEVPLKVLDSTKFSELPELITYCHGDLKEAIYELIIERMYGLIISNLGDISSEVEKFKGMP